MLIRYLAVGTGGALGALTRYGVTMLWNENGILPWGTLAVNGVGCFLLALFFTLVLKKYSSSSYLVLAVATGYVGSLTTFSAISVEVIQLGQKSVACAMGYLTLTVGIGYFLAWVGLTCGDLIWRLWEGRHNEAKL